MAKRTRKSKSSKARATPRKGLPGTALILTARRLFWRVIAFGFILVVAVTALYAVINPVTTPYMLSESRRLGSLSHDFVPIERIAPVMVRSTVAAEDANFCLHWGLDVDAIRDRIDHGDLHFPNGCRPAWRRLAGRQRTVVHEGCCGRLR